MSYSQTFRRTIAVHYSGSRSVSYPASQHGGSMTVNYSGTAYEDVDVDIEVDTDAFDASVRNCNSNVNALTMSVGAMNAAQCAAINEHAEKVSTTIINGFFQSVRTELETQCSQYKQKLEARLMLLQKQAQMLKEKREQMGADYARTCARYHKIFTDINKELENRIHEIDRPVFDLVRMVDRQSDRMLHTDLVQTPVTVGRESGLLQAQIGAATVKNHAAEAMGEVSRFLVSKSVADRTIRDSMTEGTGRDSYYVPVCFMRTRGPERSDDVQCRFAEGLVSDSGAFARRLDSILSRHGFPSAPDSRVKDYMREQTARTVSGDSSHSARVRDLINRFIGD